MKKLLIFLLRLIASVPAAIVAVGCFLLTIMTGNAMFLNGSAEVFAMLWSPNEDSYRSFY